MRILEFNVRKQRLTKKIGCDFDGLVAGSVGYLRARFLFLDNEWDKCDVKIVRFWVDNREHAVYIDENGFCDIPPEVTAKQLFGVSLLGVAPGYKIETNRTIVKQGVI